MRFPLKWKIVLIVVLVAVLPVAMTTLVSLKITKSQLEHELNFRGETSILDTCSVFSEKIAEADRITQFISRAAQIRSYMDQGVMQEKMATISDFWPLGIVEIFGPDKTLLARNYTNRPGMEDFFTEITDPLLDKALALENVSDYYSYPKGLSIKVTAPIVDKDTLESLGVVVYTLPFNTILMQSIKARVNAQVSVLKKGDTHLLTTFQSEDGELRTSAWNSFAREDILDNESIFQRHETILGEDYTTTYKLLKNKEGATVCTLVTAIPSGELYKSQERIFNTIFASSTVAFALAFIFGLIMTRSFTKSVHILLESMKKVAAGSMSERAHTGSRDEIEDLAMQFNAMAENLSQSFNRIKEQKNEIILLQSHLSNIIESMPSMLVAVDGDGIISEWNKAAERLTGISREQARKSLLTDIIPLKSEEKDKFISLLAGGCHQKYEQVPRKIGEEIRIMDITYYPLVEEQAVAGAVIRVDDVTDQVRMQEMMVQTEKMMSIGGLAAGMAHEINNPLSGIISSAQNMVVRTSVGFDKNMAVAKECGVDINGVRKYLEKRDILTFVENIRESGLRASEIVKNMLHFSKPNTNRALTGTDLVQLAEKALSLASNDYDLKKEYDFKNIQVIRQFDPELPTAYCVPTEIEQVLFNLFKNSAQAMYTYSRKGFNPKITIRMFLEKGYFNIHVEDNGPGMEDNVRKRIFEPFFTTKEVGIGTGLGLSVCYFIITSNHKGTFTVSSVPGRGSLFVIRLPLAL